MMSKLVYGVGFNDRSRPSSDGFSVLKEYHLWRGMIERCFDRKCQALKPNYKGCDVSDNFLNYSYFYDWCHKQIGFGKVDEKGKSWCLDKDILFTGNKLYSEDTCAFVPHEINSFFVDCGAKRGEYPVGVSLNKTSGKFQARCSVNGKTQRIGLFNTPEEAFAVYKPFKETLCKELAIKWKEEIDPRVYEAMMKWEVTNETPANI